ncbi:MAG: hypothetical protein UY14_C0002G0014 [Parcubacteria group bacterium GW2011_GWA1_47_9]|nr:MAG: hypothetical protein UY14_C0002G0014 [Parcubacteria group bacterium GW2011_GWA1_47_9]
MRKEVVAISSILVAALIAALVHAIVLGNLSQIFETVENTTNQTVSPKSTFIGPALSLVRTGSLGSGGKHIGFVQRGPGYAVALGGAFFLLGERMVAIFLVNLFSLLLTIFFLWRISARFLSGLWQYAPPFMLALFWEASAFVWLGSYELFTMAIATFAVFSFLKYHETRHYGWLALSSFLLAFWVLERPLLLYFVPIAFFLPVLWNRKVFSFGKLIFHLGVFTIIVVVIIGTWSFRNHIVIGTWQLGSGGHILLRRATQLDFSTREVISMYLSYAWC